MTKALGDAKSVTFTFTAEIYDEKPQVARCVVDIDQEVAAFWLANRWFTAPCNLVRGSD
jgi:hypothetical protein